MFSCTTSVEFIPKAGGNEEICLFSSHRDIFILNQEEQKDIDGVGDFGPSNGKFFFTSKK